MWQGNMTVQPVVTLDQAGNMQEAPEPVQDQQEMLEPEGPQPQQHGSESPPLSIEMETLEGLDVSEFETSGLPAAPEQKETLGEGITARGFLDKKAFFSMYFRPMHDLPSAWAGIESLKIHDSEIAAAQAASDAVYDIAEETPSLHWLIKPGGVWMQRVVVILAYTGPKMVAVRNEVRQKKKTAAAAREQLQNAN